MRNFKKLFTFMLAISIVFTACNKDTSLTKVKNIDPTEQKILNFKEKMKNVDKSGETMSIEDAVWNIEAALNYTYYNPAVNDILGVDTISVTVNVLDNGEVNFDGVVSAYNQLENNLINTLGENNMQLADLLFVENNNKSDEQILELIVLKAPNGGTTPPTFIGSFGSTDYWKPVFEEGKCDVYDGQMIGEDASSMIERKINLLRISLPGGYATDVETIYVGAYDTSSGYQGFFWDGQSDDCINPTEMNYWLNKGKEIAESKKPTGKKLVSCDYFYDSPYSGTWYHMANFNYAIWHSTSPADNIR